MLLDCWTREDAEEDCSDNVAGCWAGAVVTRSTRAPELSKANPMRGKPARGLARGMSMSGSEEDLN